jgi:hypothetical protein
MNDLRAVTASNIAQLQLGADLLNVVDGERYRATGTPIYESGIGEHLRHVLEHYVCFVEGLQGNRIDYDARRRDARISEDPEFARCEIDRIVNALKTLETDDRDVRVRMSSSPEEPAERAWSASTLKRELQYLLAHTIHHYALIALILRLEGVRPETSFGVAPSTLRHLSSTAAAG